MFYLSDLLYLLMLVYLKSREPRQTGDRLNTLFSDQALMQK